jgi:hypothetical protein
MSKIIYIMGCGRSGTTLLSILLGNHSNAFDVGELIDFSRFNGKPNGFDADTYNYKFWANIAKQYFSRNQISSFENLMSVSKRVESHKSFFANLFNLMPTKTMGIYKNYINDLYDTISDNIDEEIIVDSSKYPGRALAISKIGNKEFYIIYMVRHPIGVVESFRKSDIAQRSKGFVSANLYYFVINLLCSLVLLKVDKSKFIKVRYEDLIKDPEFEIKRIQSKFNVDFRKLLRMIKDEEPLKIGCVFNGNRMRLHKNIKIIRKENKFDWNLKNAITGFINVLWH